MSEDFGELYRDPLSSDPLSLLSYLPIVKYSGGKYGFGVPGAVSGAVKGIHDAVTLPQRVIAGHDPTVADATNMALTMGGSAAGVPVPRGALRVFGGVGAETANMNKLRSAKLLSEYGAPPEQVWHSTGWFKDKDGAWKFEIPDTEAKWHGRALERRQDLKDDYTGWQFGNGSGLMGPSIVAREPAKLGEVLDHPELFAAYPHLKELPVRSNGFDLNSLGGYGDKPPAIYLAGGKPEDVKSTLLHEIQHGVQHFEGFARGGHTNEFLPADFSPRWQFASEQLETAREKMMDSGINSYTIASALDAQRKGKPVPAYHQAELDKVPKDLLEEFSTAMTEYQKLAIQRKSAYDKYRLLGGEVESNNVQERLKQGSYDVFPHATEGYPSGEQILKPQFSAYPTPEEIAGYLSKTGGK